MPGNPPKKADIPLRFSEQVRDALTHLFDPVYLQDHPLQEAFVLQANDAYTKGQALREIILQAISDLRPLPNIPFNDPAYRPYTVLRQRFADGYTREEVEKNLSISRRQFFREQQRALDAMTEVLWERSQKAEAASENDEPTLADELEDLRLQKRIFSVAESLQQALSIAKSLADRRGIALSFSADVSLQVFGDESVARQLIVSLLSTLTQYCGPTLELNVKRDTKWVAITFEGVNIKTGSPALEEDLLISRRLAERIDGLIVTNTTSLTLRLPAAQETLVAIIDDNPKTLRLFQRYLAPYSQYRLILVQESIRAFEVILDSQPNIVVLDIMMQEVDGWQILQTIKADPRTKDTPVIVCSVLNEQDLAGIIGADLYLRKPVSQVGLAQALAQISYAHNAPGFPARL